MMKTRFRTSRVGGCVGVLAVMSVSAVVAGCNPEGAGTIKVGKPDEIQAKPAGSQVGGQPPSAKQAKALQIEEEAAKKHPKLH